MSTSGAAHTADPVIHKLIMWAEQRESVRAMLLTSTRARPNTTLDRFSDYDVVLVVQDVQSFATDHSWVEDFGEVLVAYWDPFPYATDDATDQVGNGLYLLFVGLPSVIYLATGGIGSHLMYRRQTRALEEARD